MKVSNLNKNKKIHNNINFDNRIIPKIRLKLNMEKRPDKLGKLRRINCLNKWDYSIYSNETFYNNKSIDLNKSHNKLNTTDFYFKEKDPNKTIKETNIYINKNTNNVCRITSNNILYNRTLKERKKLNIHKEYLLNDQKYQNSYNNTLNNEKQNININNNIIININSNLETLNSSTNKTNKNKNNSKNKNNKKCKNSSKDKNTSKDKNNSKDIKDKNNSKDKINNKDKNNSKDKNYFKIKSYSRYKEKSQKKEIKINKDDENRNFFGLKEKEMNDEIQNVEIYEYKKYINLENITNNQIPKEYLNIIYYNLLKEEKQGIIPKPVYNYMNDQNDINEQMRSILIDWIIDVHFKFGFTDETLYMTVLIIDRYATIRQISRLNLQLVGITALMIACKHEEIDLPKIDDYLYITDNAYTKQDMVKMEYDILRALNFSLLYPSPIKFFEYLSVNFNFSKKLHCMGKYLMETFLIDIKNIKYKPSVISCACAYIVMKFFKFDRYQESYNKKFYMLDESEVLPLGHDVKDCAQDICFLVDNIDCSNYVSCYKKYSKKEFEKVALIIENKQNIFFI